MGFLSDIIDDVRGFVADTIQITAPIAGAIFGGPAGFAAGTAAGQLLGGVIAPSPDPPPPRQLVVTAPPPAPAFPQIGTIGFAGAGAPTATAAPPGAFAGLFTGMTPLLLIGGIVLIFIVVGNR